MIDATPLLKQLTLVKVLSDTHLSKVYRMRHKTKDREYALKVVDINNTHPKLNIEKEIYFYENIPPHHNILKYYGHARIEDNILIVLEYIHGGDMWTHYLKHGKTKKQSQFRIAKHIYQLCDVLKYLHNNGIVHADLKAENVLIDDQDNVKLCDFGLSFIDRDDYPLEKDRTLCGTIGCLSPELCINICPETKRLLKYPTSSVDIWALGVLLYEITHNRSPFIDPSEEKLYQIPGAGLDTYMLYQVLIKPPLYDDDDKYINDVLKRMFRKNPKLRATLSDVQRSEWMKRVYLEPSTKMYLESLHE